jgi:uncharacterized protein YbaR (Trm112 family)
MILAPFGMLRLLCYTRFLKQRMRRSAASPSENEDMPLPILDILRCPACAPREGADPGRLEPIDEKWLVCQDCGRKYPIRDRIPVLIIAEGDKYRHVAVDELGEP